MPINKENNNPSTSPSDLKLLSLDFEKKLLLYQLEQEKAKSAKRVDVVQSNFEQKIEDLQSQLKEKENLIQHLTLLSSQEQAVSPTVPNTTNNTVTENPPECKRNESDIRKIEDLEQQIASWHKDKEKMAFQMQMSTTEKHSLLGQIFQITMEKQEEKEKFLQSSKELELQISSQKTEIENLSKKIREDEKKNGKKIKELEKELQNKQTNQKGLNVEIVVLKNELKQTQDELQKEKETLLFEQNEFKVKLENLTINLESKTSQVNQLESTVNQLQKDLQKMGNGGQFKNVCTKIQELGKSMERMFDQQFEEKEKKITQLKRQLKESKLCSICFDEMESNGNHRSVSLPCGHIFGDSCLRSTFQHSQSCPTCRIAANSQSCRFIYLN